ncbi:MAG TPA: CHAT domain-containing protein [Planctomycetota bacterium]|nr:CHAT domain-containing protein [Planctomycetota bacterium]
MWSGVSAPRVLRGGSWEATRELMVDFYRRLWVGGEPKAQALWKAKMRLRGAVDEAGRPRYRTRDWAGWVLTGDPR